jgi:hypothetical protein
MLDPKTENFLTRGNWSWKYHDIVEFSKIDLKHSRENPARLNRKIDEDRTVHYAMEMQNGVEFPAVVLLHPSDNGKFPYDVATGMHRLTAADVADLTSFDAYVVTEPDQYRREVLVRQLNTIEGQGVTVRESILQIIMLHEKYPERSLNALAKEWGLKSGSVHAVWRAESAKRRARQFGFDFDRAKLTQGASGALAGIHSDRVFKEAASFIVNHVPPTATIDEMCRELRTVRDESDSLAIIEKFRDAEEERQARNRAKHARTSPAPAHKLIGNARRFNNQVSKGLEHLYIASLPGTMQAKVVLEELITNAKRVLAEIERIDSLRKTEAA